MMLLTPAAQQRTVGGILHRRVLEGVLRIRRRPAPEDQLGVHELSLGCDGSCGAIAEGLGLAGHHEVISAVATVPKQQLDERANLSDVFTSAI
jgi:hypothetical protein